MHAIRAPPRRADLGAKGAPVRRSPLGGPCPALELGGGRQGERVVCRAQHREGAEGATAPARQPPWPRAPGWGRSVGGDASGAAGEQKQKKGETRFDQACRMLSRRGSLKPTTKLATPVPPHARRPVRLCNRGRARPVQSSGVTCYPVRDGAAPPTNPHHQKKPRKRCAPKHNNTPRVARGPSPSWP